MKSHSIEEGVSSGTLRDGPLVRMTLELSQRIGRAKNIKDFIISHVVSVIKECTLLWTENSRLKDLH